MLTVRGLIVGFLTADDSSSTADRSSVYFIYRHSDNREARIDVDIPMILFAPRRPALLRLECLASTLSCEYRLLALSILCSRAMAPRDETLHRCCSRPVSIRTSRPVRRLSRVWAWWNAFFFRCLPSRTRYTRCNLDSDYASSLANELENVCSRATRFGYRRVRIYTQ